MSSNENVIELEGIEFKCFSLIEYSSLIELLKLLTKKYKNLEEKMGILDSRMIEKDKRISELEIMLKGVSQSKDDKFPSIVNEPPKTPPKTEEKEKSIINDDDFLDDNKNDEDSNKNKEPEKDDNDENMDNVSEPKKEESQAELNKTESNINKSAINENKEKDDNENENENKEDENENKDDDKDKEKDDNKDKEEDKKETEEKVEEKVEKVEEKVEKKEVIEIKEKEKEKEIIIPTPKRVETTKEEKKQTDTATDNKNEIQRRNNEQEILENREIISKILKKLKAHDKQINELAIKTNEHAIMNKNIKKNKNDIEDLSKRINQLKESIGDINGKLLAFNEEFDKVKVKVQDFNVYDLFKGGSGEGNLDAAKVLVMNLENKIFKKFGLYDERNKKMDKDFYKMQEDVKNALAIVDGMKTTTKRNTDSINELNENFNTTKSNHENSINDIQRRIEQITNKINAGPDFSQIKKEFDKKLKDLEEKLNSKIDLFLNKETTEETPNGPTLKVEDLAMMKDLRRRIGELEKFVSNTFDRINADDMKNRISVLENEMPKRASKYEVNELKEKMKNLDEFVKDLNFKVDSLQQFTEKVRLDLAQIIKKIEFLSGEYSKLAFNKIGKSSDEGKGVVDMSKFIDFNVFNDNKKDVNSKFEKVRLGFEDLSREIEEILSKLAHTPTDKDFSQFQTIIKNIIEDLKINCNKKYADKYETAKSIKFLETQIKTIHEGINKRNEVGDNWLLAKKPINSYVCASCEASIRGELDKRTEYVAWNRYPQREDKAYRLGHGFSRMLQMVNEDIIKSAGEKGYSSDEDKKLNIKNSGVNIEKTYSVNASVKLPKVTKRKPAISSAAPLQTDPNISSSPYDEAENTDNNNNNNMNKPQIVKIFRKNKGGSNISPNKNSEVITHRSNEYSVNEKNMPSNEDLPPINSNENDK